MAFTRSTYFQAINISNLLLITFTCLLTILLSQAEIIQQIRIPINGMVEQGEWQYYYVDPSLFSGRLANFALTPLSGDVYMYVSTNGQLSLECGKCLAKKPSLLLTARDENWPMKNNIFTVGVYGNTIGTFALTMWSNSSAEHISLIDGLPQIGHAFKGEYINFKYKVNGPTGTKLYLSVVSHNGDADIFVSLTDPFPTSMNYDYSSRSYGRDGLFIDIEENTPREIWISIYGYTEGDYFSVAASETNTSTLISENILVASKANDMRYFVYNNLQLQNLKFEAYSSKNTMLYVKFGSKPTESVYDRRMWLNDNNEMMISKEDSHIGLYYIGIDVGMAMLTVESIPDFELLTDDTPLNRTIAQNELKYYKYIKRSNQNDRVQVKVLSGSVKLYHSRESQRANQYVFEKESYGNVSELAELFFPYKGDLQLAVFGQVDSSYIITYITFNPPMELMNGYGLYWLNLPYGTKHFFTFKVNQQELANTDIIFTNSRRGMALYVTTEDYFPPKGGPSSWQTYDSSLIIPGNSKMITSNVFKLTIYGNLDENPPFYSFLALQSNKSITLQDDEIVSFTTVKSDFYRFYQYPIQNRVQLQISLESVGEVLICWSTTNTNPSLGCGPEKVNGEKLMDLFVIGEFLYISVKTLSETPVSYSLKVKQQFEYLVLNSASYERTVAENDIYQFKFEHRIIDPKLTFSLLNITGSTIMYISNDCQPANETHHHWKIEPENQFGQFLLLKDQNPPQCYAIGVKGLSNSTFKLSAFNNNMFLNLGQTVFVKASTDGVDNLFNLYTGKKSNDLVVNIKAISGYSKVKVSTNIGFPNYEYFSNGDQDRWIVIPMPSTSSENFYQLLVAVSGNEGEPNPIIQLTVDKNICYGKISYSNSVCSGHGKCVDYDNCKCLEGYVGDECQSFKCFDILMSNNSVCSSRGSCKSPNKCECSKGYLGDSCEFIECFGIPSSDQQVCSENGICSSFNNCECNYGYFGKECELNVLCPYSEKDSFYCSNIELTNGTAETKIIQVENITQYLNVKFEKFENIFLVLPSIISDYEYLNQTLGDATLTMVSSVLPSLPIGNNSKVVSPVINFILIQNGTTERIEITNLKEPINLYLYNISFQKETQSRISCAFHDGNDWIIPLDLKTSILDEIQQGNSTTLSVSCSSKSWPSFIAIISQFEIPIPPQESRLHYSTPFPKPPHESSHAADPIVDVRENHNYYYFIGLGLIIAVIVIIATVGVVTFVIYKRKASSGSVKDHQEKKENYENVNYANLGEDEA